MIYEDKIDFHEFGLIEPNQIYFFTDKFIKDSFNQDLKKILIITGKGELIRPCVQKALKNNKLVKKFLRASEYNGGSGAFEVWLKD